MRNLNLQYEHSGHVGLPPGNGQRHAQILKAEVAVVQVQGHVGAPC